MRPCITWQGRATGMTSQNIVITNPSRRGMRQRCWARAAWRKKLYAFQQRNVLQQLQTRLDQRYYLAILQVYNDSQIRQHSP